MNAHIRLIPAVSLVLCLTTSLPAVGQTWTTGRSNPVPVAQIAFPLEVNEPWDPVIDHVANRIYVPLRAESRLAVLDGTLDVVIQKLTLSFGGVTANPMAAAIDPARKKLFIQAELVDPVTQRASFPLWVLDTATYQVEEVFDPETGAESPLNMVVNPLTGVLYLPGNPMKAFDPSRSALDPQRLVALNVPHGGVPLQLDALSKRLYALRFDGRTLVWIDLDPTNSSFHQPTDLLLPPIELGALEFEPSSKSVLALSHGYGDFHALYVYSDNPESTGYRTWSRFPLIAEPENPNHPGQNIRLIRGTAFDQARRILYVLYADFNFVWSEDCVLVAVDIVTGQRLSNVVLPFPEFHGAETSMSMNHVTGKLYISGRRVVAVYRDMGVDAADITASVAPQTVETPALTVSFQTALNDGVLSVQRIDPTAVSAAAAGQFLFENTGGFDVSTTAILQGDIELCFATDREDPNFSNLLVLHAETVDGQLQWVDRTSSRNPSSGTICAQVSSLSPFALARRAPPILRVMPMFDQSKAHRAGSTLPIKIRVIDEAGINVSDPGLIVATSDIQRVGEATATQVIDAGHANPDGGFRFSPELQGYIYNWSSRGLPGGSYELRISVGGTANVIALQLK